MQKIIDTIVMDLEIAEEVKNVPGGWNNHEGMGLGSAVAYSFLKDRYFFFLHDTSKPKLLELLNGNRVITFNGVNFDSKVILGNDRIAIPSENNMSVKLSNKDESISWVEYDIFLHCLKFVHNVDLKESISKRSPGGLKLEEIAIQTLGPKFDKTTSGAMAPVLYKEKKYDELLEYNLQDTILTKMVYEFANRYHYLLDKGSKKITIVT